MYETANEWKQSRQFDKEEGNGRGQSVHFRDYGIAVAGSHFILIEKMAHGPVVQNRESRKRPNWDAPMTFHQGHHTGPVPNNWENKRKACYISQRTQRLTQNG